ncbi:MAG: DUF3362 domain-containing protein, partial [Gammaproteobacteria bacterium]|nr:DUF3362 domain-containing protein [Gammaproteobacteria bacterium]
PEHSREGPLSKMMKPGMGAYYKFKELFDKYSKEAGKEQYLIPYFIAAHPGTTDEDMLELALWLKQNGFRADQVQAFLPSPMATATAMYYSGKNPLRKVNRSSEAVYIPKGLKQRRLHKAFLRYHDANNWPMLRAALRRMNRTDLIGSGKHQLIQTYQPAMYRDVQVSRETGRRERPGTGQVHEGQRRTGKYECRGRQDAGSDRGGKRFATQHTGLPRFAPKKSDARHRVGERPRKTLHPGSPTGAGKRR